jgi:hypothetical protein
MGENCRDQQTLQIWMSQYNMFVLEKHLRNRVVYGSKQASGEDEKHEHLKTCYS